MSAIIKFIDFTTLNQPIYTNLPIENIIFKKKVLKNPNRTQVHNEQYI